MKRFGHLWDELVSFENLYRAYRLARRGKRCRREVERFEYHREYELHQLRDELLTGRYQPGAYRTFILHDRKPRLISAAPFRDRVVHHAFCNVVEPIFERTFIHDSYASRRGKGTHAAIRRYQEFARCSAYVLKCDIRKFFPSIDHQILQERLARKIKDARTLELARRIIANSNAQEPVPGMFAGDNLLTQLERRRGLPIGNQTSQFFANVYLDALDHFVKEQLRCRCYLRYVDDFVILDDDKHRLADVREAANQFLVSLRLWLHPQKRVISRTTDGLRLLGYRVWPNRIRLTPDSVVRTRRRMRRYQRWFRDGRLSAAEVTQRIRAWIGHALQADGVEYRSDILGDIVFTRPTAEPSCSARGLLEQQRQEHPLSEPQQEHAGQPEQQQRVPIGEHSAAAPAAPPEL
jgi:retron-type reverse transcriptase